MLLRSLLIKAYMYLWAISDSDFVTNFLHGFCNFAPFNKKGCTLSFEIMKLKEKKNTNISVVIEGKKTEGSELIVIIIHSKYFPDADWLRAHA